MALSFCIQSILVLGALVHGAIAQDPASSEVLSTSRLSSNSESTSETSIVVTTSNNTTSTTYSIREPITTWNITTSTTDESWPPKATQPGQPSGCNRWHLVMAGSTCNNIINRYSAFMTREEFFEWNPELHTDCSGLFVDYYVCVGIRSNATADLEWSTSTPPFTPPPEPTTHLPTTVTSIDSNFTPEPTHGAMPEDCAHFHQAAPDETCRSILKTYSYITEAQFFEWNPVLKNNCDGLWKDTWYCVGLKDQRPLPPTVTTRPSSVPENSAKDCNRWYYTTGGETCEDIAIMFGGFDAKGFIAMNPSVLSDCSDIEDRMWYCVGTPDTPSNTATQAPSQPESATGRVTQTGISEDCEAYWLVSRQDTCESISEANGNSSADLIAWNTALGSDCKGLEANYYVCVRAGVVVSSSATATTTENESLTSAFS
ncbi:uncharacterized protein NECHADRAFT_86238 [Fusarium vanettenii 77-13-4]|uniref:LysM domain-containing protein n=1 Tax=Fusarium vanettenii (strain ATCC MYA-4622 / CBS 123669 / FGSC 9596 / NRRL 45880 / 77-13-4) TaxID=660122 RepID=C7ZER5_FUSV7|nr:uncharacterized protein NECHADRAFT_86238 [Fusarium vanettenii 77-13-4]EEU37422.1 hypothetical protein NECHADRAFT_86238 [Fusarium vanettenii 77-13-4]